ncbi:glycosyltransferase family 2 protein [Formosa sp. PL04]|uniref:glycosyltransferase family 2 protein n=1 Tax=Formosa sp. PL04 TaxID=3081755 RepID=UPI002981FA5F|nr:glycosyltransferase family 2 protein [Formosa sp. PL04]MDW5290745.1 glycosyltransferase family 2 protein [Formosa sp. PL04]
MKIALVLTVKNESRLLRNHLLYHKAIGVDRAFVYFDNTTDNGKESIADLNFVTISNSVPAETYAHLDYLHKFTSQAIEHHTARQCLNAFDAQKICESEKIDWLISIDADELITDGLEDSSNLKVFFQTVPKNIEVISFKTLEALQRRMHYKNVFAEETLFKFNRVAFYRYINNPFNSTKLKTNWWYGHEVGKSAIRISSDLIPHNVHHFIRKDGSKPLRRVAGYLLHYHIYDANDFIKKFKNFENHPNTFLSGNKVVELKLLLRDVVNKLNLNEDELKNYYKENILFGAISIRKFKIGRRYLFFKIKPKPLGEIKSVQKTFETFIS